MEIERNVAKIGFKKLAAGCQCSIGREKLLTAPLYRVLTSEPRIATEDSRIQTAPAVREIESFKCPVSHIMVIFKSPLHPGDYHNKIYPATTPVEYLKLNLAKLLDIDNSNLILAKKRCVLKDSALISELKTDLSGNLIIDVFTLDSENFSLASIPKDTFIQEFLNAFTPKKKMIPYIVIKFKVRHQNGVFTRSYHSIMKIHEIKKNLAELFQVDPDNMVLLRGENPLMDRMILNDLDYDEFGNTELELLMKNDEKLDLNKLYKELIINDILRVAVPFGSTMKQINVEIFYDPYEKPFLGGFRNKETGVVYHHAFTQTPQKPERLPPEKKNCRDTQTAEERVKIVDTPYSRATQLTDCGGRIFIPTVTDRIVNPKPYETYEEMIARLNHKYYATVIQRAFRHHQFRQKVRRWLDVCLERIARMKEEERLEREAMERRLRRDLITKTFPKTREDFDQLYAMVDQWKKGEIERISSHHAKGPKTAELSVVLEKEVELLRCIDSFRYQVQDDNRKIREKKYLEDLTKPITWYDKNRRVISMETIEIQKAKKLKELYSAFLREDMEVKERLELLVDMKFALQPFRHPLAEEIISLLDQEADLLVRRCNNRELEFLRRRIAGSVLQFMKTSELNSAITKLRNLREYRKMEDDKLHLCYMCDQVKPYTDFPLYTRMTEFATCTSCSWKDVTQRKWIDMTPYKFILRALQHDERRRKCYGSLAFVLREKDVFFIIEKLWHSHSAISECEDLTQLRLCRWYVRQDWAPWNCFLVTVQEMRAHLKLDKPEEVYDEELVKKVKNKHKLAKASFQQLMAVDKTFTETGEWQTVRVPATVRAQGVTPI